MRRCTVALPLLRPACRRDSQAFLVFDVDEKDAGDAALDGSAVAGEESAVTLWIQAAAEDNAAAICPEGTDWQTNAGCLDGRAPAGSIIGRPRTEARVEWTPAPWRVEHAVQRSVNIAPVLQVRPGRARVKDSQRL
jgi:hypothetical protein